MKTHSKTILTIKSYIKFVVLALIVAFAFSCSPEDGKDGAPGTNGMDGADGENGEDGSANVYYSAWFEPIESDYSVNNSDLKSLPIDLPGYNPDSDALLVYYYTQFGLNTSYSQTNLLPLLYISNIDGSVNKSITFKIKPYQHINYSRMYISIDKSTGNLTPQEYLWEPDPANLDNKGVRFRYMIVSGSITGKDTAAQPISHNVKPMQRVTHELISAGIDINDYHAVCDYYGIAY